MKDRFGREITYLRISVTDRCNLRCRYCMPEQGVTLLRHEDILSYEEIADVARAAAGMGVAKLRITGGEPLVRRSIETLVGMLASIDGITDLAMTTNGVLLAERAGALAEAGLQRVNISIDALDSDRYRAITRGGEVGDALGGIEAARVAGLTPIKLNCVIEDESSNAHARQVVQFGRDNGYEVRLIRKMDFPNGVFSVVEGGSGGDCHNCDRLRLSSDGFIRPCLFSDVAFDVREMGAVRALEEAIGHKPEAGSPCSHDWIHGIGG